MPYLYRKAKKVTHILKWYRDTGPMLCFNYYYRPVLIFNIFLSCICAKQKRRSVIHLQFWAYGSWDSLFPIPMSPNCKLMSPKHRTSRHCLVYWVYFFRNTDSDPSPLSWWLKKKQKKCQDLGPWTTGAFWLGLIVIASRVIPDPYLYSKWPFKWKFF